MMIPDRRHSWTMCLKLREDQSVLKDDLFFRWAKTSTKEGPTFTVGEKVDGLVQLGEVGKEWDQLTKDEFLST